MRSLQGFSDGRRAGSSPTFGKAAPALTDATRTLTPVLGSDDGGAEEPRRGPAARLRPDLPRSRPGGFARRLKWRRAASRRRTELAKLFTNIEENRRLGRAWSN